MPATEVTNFRLKHIDDVVTLVGVDGNLMIDGVVSQNVRNVVLEEVTENKKKKK